MAQKVLLICGILSPILYGVSDVVAGVQSEGYSFRDQTISELGAIGAPSRVLFAVLLLIVYGLMVRSVWGSGSQLVRTADCGSQARFSSGLV
jgi:hypothetical protein